MRVLSAFLFLLVTCCSSKPDTLVEGGYDEQEMEAAIERARSEVDFFIAELRNPTGENRAVKAPIKDGEIVEHFWLVDVSFRDGKFSGTINNDPGMVTNVRFGQKWTVGKEDISDWMFIREGKIHGNYTLRPLLETMPEDEADKWRSLFATP